MTVAVVAWPTVRVLRPGDFVPMPWRNGRGTTLELLREEDGAGALLWRLSTATVTEASDFSRFPGFDRILMLIEGPGFSLHFGGHRPSVVAEPLSPVRFSGDWITRAEAVTGASRDLNVITASGRVQAGILVHTDGAFVGPPADRSLFLAVCGSWSLQVGDETHAVAADELLVVSGGERSPLKGEGTGVLVQVDLQLASRQTDTSAKL